MNVVGLSMASRGPAPRNAWKPANDTESWRDQADSGDLEDVPAAVVCAHCGCGDCPGCAEFADEVTHASKVVAIVPWERPGPVLWRLWHTSRLATTNAETFFGALPEGEASPALSFAVLVETLAVSSLTLMLAPALWVVFPELMVATAADLLGSVVVRAVVLGVPILVAGMIVLHTIHGVSLDLGARLLGSARKGRGVRFALYACAWDFYTLPLGLVLVAVLQGPRAAVRALPLGLTVPLRASQAYARGIHHLDEALARRAARLSSVLSLTMLLGALWVAATVGLVYAWLL